ncbi:Uncharacterised protein [Yersinia intermedia]|uniref:hypothetical protein n=1 Tax=Yersinia intermedia TaxID=631 RepID=UPI0005E686AD|nr:hypothetical protein [Yersinia intermedia]CNJ79925.1 Uncharacterised protein [Yersinia intermedia]
MFPYPNTKLFVGIPSNQIAKNAGSIGVITSFSSKNGKNENIISITSQGLGEEDIKLQADYLIKLKGSTIWVWLGEDAEPIVGEMLDVKIHSDLANGVTFKSIEVIFKTTF